MLGGFKGLVPQRLARNMDKEHAAAAALDPVGRPADQGICIEAS